MLATILAAACGSRTSLDLGEVSGVDAGAKHDAGLDFPVGTFASCAEGLDGPDGNTFLDTSGVIEGAVLTVAHDGPRVTARFAEQGGPTNTFTFDPTTDVSAALNGDAVIDGFAGLCVQGPGDEGSFAATIEATAGALTYDAGTMFLSFVGTIRGGQGSPCGSSTASARVWIACGGAAPPPSTPAAPAVPSAFPLGNYACNSQLDAYLESAGIQDYATSGDSGTLRLTSSGTGVTAHYTDDSTVAGTLDFTATSPTTASVVAGGSLRAPCTVPISITGPQPPDTPQTLEVAAASLTLDDDTLFLSFRGTITSQCTGALATGSLLCTKQ